MNDDFTISVIGCGYVGKLLARRFLERAIPVTGYVSSEASLADCAVQDIPCGILNLDNPLVKPDVGGQRVIYLVPPPRSGRTDTRILHFLSAIESHLPDKLVLISTTGVYGDCDGAWIDETWPLNPKADRAHRRANAEQQAQQFCEQHDIPLVILRVAGIYGPGKIPVQRIKSGEPIVNQEDSPYTNRIHVADLVTVCEKALLDIHITGVYNVTDGHPGTMYDYFTGVAETINLPVPPAISLEQAKLQLSAGMMSYMAESRRISNRKLLNDFNISLAYPDLDHGLHSLINTTN